MDKPSLYKNPINKIVNTNEDVYKIDKDNLQVKAETNSNRNVPYISIKSKIRNIFASQNYIYKADVVIKLKDNLIERRIIGMQNEQLITMDNEMIPINEIVDINLK